MLIMLCIYVSYASPGSLQRSVMVEMLVLIRRKRKHKRCSYNLERSPSQAAGLNQKCEITRLKNGSLNC